MLVFFNRPYSTNVKLNLLKANIFNFDKFFVHFLVSSVNYHTELWFCEIKWFAQLVSMRVDIIGLHQLLRRTTLACKKYNACSPYLSSQLAQVPSVTMNQVLYRHNVRPSSRKFRCHGRKANGQQLSNNLQRPTADFWQNGSFEPIASVTQQYRIDRWRWIWRETNEYRLFPGISPSYGTVWTLWSQH